MRKDKDGFLADWLGSSHRKAERTNLSKNAIKTDKWDREDVKNVFEELPDLQVADDRLCNITDTGHHAMEDIFLVAVKSDPDQFNPNDMNPEYLVNREVNKQAQNMKELEEMRQYTVGDPIGSALATIAMEPDMENIFDRLKEEQKLAKKIADEQGQLGQKEAEARDLDEMFEEWKSAGNEDPAEAMDFQAQQDALQQQMQALQDQIAQDANKLQEDLEKKRPQIQNGLRKGMNKASEQAADIEQAAMMWGTEPGQLTHLPARERLEFAKKVQTPKFKKMAQLIGPLMRLAMAEQSRKTDFGRDEVHDIVYGDDLARVLPTELADLRHPILKKQFFRKFLEKQLLQYELRGVEKVAKGGIIFLEDGSGSMGGDREIWAKGVGLALLQIARKQKRSFYGIHFGSPGQIACFDFRDPNLIDPDKVMEFASIFFNGGTDFCTPLAKALDILREEFDVKGCVKGDIVFATDGQCPVPPKFLEDFKAEQARLGFRVFGINIGGTVRDEPMATICDNRVSTITDLMSGEDVRDIFRAV